ncbi:MAG: PAS domain-containing protein [Planctomycetaceae bacterium]|nr:PAS domain-containing protein [Planctomycetaceae bacterium]
MDFEEFSLQNKVLEGRFYALRSDSDGSTERLQERLEEASVALGTALEQLRVAEETLRGRDKELETVRMAAEAERRRYRDLFDFAPDGYLVTDPVGVIAEANRAAAALLGVAGEDLAGRDLAACVADDERPTFHAERERLLLLGGRREWEIRLLRRDGEPFEAAVTAAVVPDWDDEPVALRWIIRKVPARRRVEDVLTREREARVAAEAETRRLLELVQGIDAILWEAEPDGRYRFVSRRAEELLGYPVGRWLGEPGFWAGMIHPDDREWATAHRQQCLREGRDRELEYRLIAADGRVVWFRESLRLIRDEQGRTKALRGAMWNIGRRKKVERQLYIDKREMGEQLADLTYLQELSRRLWATLELEPLLEETLAAAMAIEGAEMGLVRLYDPQRDELETVASVGLSEVFLERFGRVRAGVAACGLAIARGGPVGIEDVEAEAAYAPLLEAARLGGYRAVSSTPLISFRGELLGTIAVFFREPHRTPERQVRLVELFARQAADVVEHARLYRNLREADRHKDEALAVLAHELRNPLAVILTAAHAQRPREDDPRDQGGARDLVIRQARRMTRLVDDLFDASRIARGEIELRMEAVELSTVVAGAVEAVRPLIDDRRHELTIAPPSGPVRLVADPGRLEQVIVNLLTNAARYTEPGGRVTLETDREGDQVVIKVRDTGIGIAPELLPRVFDPFVQGDRASARSQGGLGLGLALVRGLVERHGGTVAVSSAGPGRGSEFIVRLPVGRTEPEAPSSGDAHRKPTPPAGASRARRVLVVDDQPDSARSLARLLESWGHETRTAHDGPSALAEADAHRPEVVLLDVELPGMDGHEVARRLRAPGGEGLRIVALTGFSQEEDRRQALGSGFDLYLVKPVDLDDLRQSLE